MESEKRISINTIIKYFAYAAIAVEAVFAAFWLFKNIGVYQSDYIAHTYIQAADSLVVDDSMGILYALIVRVLGHGAVLQIVQIVVGTLALWFFASSLFGKGAAGVLTGVVALNPMILQAETAVSPNALVLSCVLVAIGSAVKSKSNAKWYVGLFVPALMAGFLNPDYAYLFAIVGVVFFVVRCIVRKKFEVVLLALVLLAAVVPAVTNHFISDDKAYGRVGRTPAFLMMQRVVWPHMFDYSELADSWVAYYKGETDVDYGYTMIDTARIPENLAMSFAYGFENSIGTENAQSFYKTTVEYSLGKGFGFWARDVISDEILYVLAPASAAYAYVTRMTDTSVVNGLYYMFKTAPEISKVYFVFSSMALAVLIALYVVAGVVKVCRKEANKASATVSLLLIILLLSLYATLICVREFDYRNVLFMVVGWPAAVMALTERRDTL